MKIYKGKFKPIYSGVSIENDNIYFNYDKDTDRDVLKLNEDVSHVQVRNGIQYYFAYKYTNRATADDKHIFRNYIKGINGSGKDYESTVRKFVHLGVRRLASMKPLSSFGGVVCIESYHPSRKFSLMNLMYTELQGYSEDPFIDFKLIKKLCKEVKVDDEKLKRLLRRQNYEEWQIKSLIDNLHENLDNPENENKMFEIKKIVPPILRKGLCDFVKFEDPKQKEIYQKLQGVDILIYDDVITTGTTIKEIIRYLRSINNKNTLSVFVLVNQF